MRRAARVDAVSREIIAALRVCGWRWLDLSRVGQGCPDGLAYQASTGRLALIELKGPKRTLTPDQREFHQEWPVTILRSEQAAIDFAIELRCAAAREGAGQ